MVDRPVLLGPLVGFHRFLSLYPLQSPFGISQSINKSIIVLV